MTIKLYEIDETYINYLKQYDNKLLSNHFKTHNRKYLGVGLKINNNDYFMPLSSPDAKDYDKFGNPRKTIVPIFRIFDHKKNFLGKVLINNMIPVPSSELVPYDIQKEKDLKYKSLITKQVRVLNKNDKTLIKNAKLLYKQKNMKFNIKYLKATVDFKVLENAKNKYVNRTKVKNISNNKSNVKINKSTTKTSYLKLNQEFIAKEEKKKYTKVVTKNKQI